MNILIFRPKSAAFMISVKALVGALLLAAGGERIFAASPDSRSPDSTASGAAAAAPRAGEFELAQAPEDEPADKPAEKPAKKPGKKTEPAEGEGEDEPKFPYKNRIESPDLSGGLGWINTAGPLELADLKGKFVLLDFWTYCCINCMHILPELKKLEKAYPNELVVVGVHSAKFEGEENSKNIAEAVER